MRIKYFCIVSGKSLKCSELVYTVAFHIFLFYNENRFNRNKGLMMFEKTSCSRISIAGFNGISGDEIRKTTSQLDETPLGLALLKREAGQALTVAEKELVQVFDRSNLRY